MYCVYFEVMRFQNKYLRFSFEDGGSILNFEVKPYGMIIIVYEIITSLL